MSVTSGFFNSLNGDRKYDAEQMSEIFNGIINDGVLANIGTAFAVNAYSGLNIQVGPGRAWFKSRWIKNDNILPMVLSESELVLDRIDAIVIEVDNSEAVRNAFIKAVKGTPSANPSRPTMVNTETKGQYPLAYILRPAGSTTVTQSNITNAVGTSDCPYVTGILQVINIDNLVAQWGAQWKEWFASTTIYGENEWKQWFAGTTEYNEELIDSWIANMQSEFLAWFHSLEVVLDGDVATQLAAKIVEINDTLYTLAKEKIIYGDLKDSNDDVITDSYGNPIEGRTVFTSNSSGDMDLDSVLASIFNIENDIADLTDRKADKAISISATLTTTGWSGSGAPYTQTVSAPGVTADPAQVVNVSAAENLTADQYEAVTGAQLWGKSKSVNSIVVAAYGDKPTVNIPIVITIYG